MSYTKNMIQEMERKATSMAPGNLSFLRSVTKNKPKKLDEIIRQLHDEEFNQIDCTKCALCCKSLGPMLFESDIERMASALKIKSSAFKDAYIKVDGDGDYAFKEMPCPFLSYDNRCSIYKNRPKACREYPHTDRKRFYQVAIKAYHNTFTCPAVFSIVRKLKKKF